MVTGEFAMFRTLSLLALATCVIAIAQAQQLPTAVRVPPIDFDNIEIKTTRHSKDFFTLEGHGGTISVLTGSDGVLMVDGQFAPLTDKIVAAIRKVSGQPIRFLINTHVHADHTGGNENFTELGALIFSRDQLRMRLLNPSPTPNGKVPPPAPAKALPVVTYDGP